MRTAHLLVCSLVAGLNLAAPATHGQQSSRELDLTMEVMQENQQPDGFINQIELPPPEFFASDSNNLDLPAATTTEEVIGDTREEAETLEETIADSIRESISIDGTGNNDTPDEDPLGNIVELPEPVNNLIDDTLPLDDTLQDTLDSVTAGGRDPVDDIVDVTTGTLEDVTDTVDGTVEDATGTVDGVTGDILQLTDTTNSSSGQASDLVDNLNGGLDDPSPVAEDNLNTELLAPMEDVSELGISDPAAEEMTQPVEDVIDAVPGLQN